MNGLDGIVRWKNLKQRLSFKGFGCCGPTWSSRTTIRNIIEEDDEDEDDYHEQEDENEEQPIIFTQDHQHSRQTPPTAAGAAPTPARNSRMMNLGMALAAERDMRRRSNVGPSKNVGPVKTLMRLIEETDGVDFRKKKKKRRETQSEEFVSENDCVCCVCMERNKGAALIPCGHTYCRVCSREMWLNRGCCPICNRSILDILDIF
ncbi:RING/U-box superfamily protein [Euphorbia peplus]|nr:RING/U-box superfamily protein [Euphorbia peplus]